MADDSGLTGKDVAVGAAILGAGVAVPIAIVAATPVAVLAAFNFGVKALLAGSTIKKFLDEDK